MKFNVNTEGGYAIKCFDHILLTGREIGGVMAYSIPENTIRHVFECEKGSSVILGDPNGELFLLSNSKIYQSLDYEFTQWTEVGKFNQKLDQPKNAPILINGKFYFWQKNGGKVFDTHLLTVESIEVKV